MNRLLRLLYHACRLLLGGIFLYAGFVKSGDVAAFAGSIAAYRIFPHAGNYLIAATLPYIEIVAGLLLVANSRVRPAALLLGLLITGFIFALVSVIVRGLQIDCGCFGAADSATPLQALLRDIGLLALAAVTYALRGILRK